MRWDAQTQLIYAKRARSDMRGHALEARLIIHPAEDNSARSFSEMCERAVCYIRFAIIARNRALAAEARRARLLEGGKP